MKIRNGSLEISPGADAHSPHQVRINEITCPCTSVNVLDQLPKRLQPAAKDQLHQIWMAPTRKEAERSFDLFVATYQAKYEGAVERLTKDRDVLLAFYDFPSEHWIHLRTTNPIESTFATVRLRHNKT